MQYTINQKIAKLIREYRKKANLTQTQLAVLSNVTQATISKFEDEKYIGHTLEVLIKIAKGLKLEVDIKLTPVELNEIEKEEKY